MIRRAGWAHELVDRAHARYKREGRALITHAPPPYRVISRPRRSSTLTVQLLKGPVDYVGHTADGQGVRFDLKSSHEPRSVRLNPTTLADHQRRELLWCHEHGGPHLAAGLLLCAYERRKAAPRAWYWCPVGFLVDRFGDGEAKSWGSVPWSVLEDAGFRCPTFDLTGCLPDHLAVSHPM